MEIVARLTLLYSLNSMMQRDMCIVLLRGHHEWEIANPGCGGGFVVATCHPASTLRPPVIYHSPRDQYHVCWSLRVALSLWNLPGVFMGVATDPCPD